MSRQVVVTTLARTDLWEVREYLDRTAGIGTAVRVLTTLHDAMDESAAGTAVGHPRPDLVPAPALFYLVFRYFVIHRVESGDSVVLRVVHSARDIAAMDV